MPSSASSVLARHVPDFKEYETLYKYFHSHPELSFCEKETAARIAQELHTRLKIPKEDIKTSIGGHGLVAIVRNGSGPTVLLRADIDALPVEEATGLPYASKKRMKSPEGIEKPVMHACGHDMHISVQLAAGECLLRARDSWKGTLLLLFQPAEEKGAGAQAMVDDGLYDKVPKPDVVLGAHVSPFRTGTIGTRRGIAMAAADSLL